MGSRDSTNEKATKWTSENGPLAKNGTFADAANFAVKNSTVAMVTYIGNYYTCHFLGRN